MHKNLLIVDGSSLLSTSFYGTVGPAYLMAKTEEDRAKALSKLLKTSDGRYTNGVYTFMKTLLKLIKEQKPTHLAVVWDISRNSFRKTQLSEDYKGTRKETPGPLKEQFKTTQDLLEGLIPQFKSSFEDEIIYEADDFAGSLVKRFEDEISCKLYTKDEDYLQLISERSSVWLVTSKAHEMFDEMGLNPKEFNVPSGAFEYTLTSLMDIKEIEPYQIVEYKALCGDSSDNIPGVKGVGPKAVVPLLREYGNIETIYEIIEGLNDKEQKELAKFFKETLGISRSPIKNLLEGKESAFLSKKLATIKTDIESIKDIELDDVKLDINNDLLKNRLLDLEIKSLM
ncbi:5'-3' exonuclease H3TH domain-containing protein [Clostridium sp. AL.422]|uniref:5'-3' exonuclease n=1 Tax=Clostridium TaxID=1485 RepID=UPI00293DBB15|nr:MULTISPECIES: 5'-3' exonuclease H3TH domain-containing protein [unclassified Clostridium]MDV4149785.1 5'-3' exonuclease H3TH domain-containing protein [Clostridium sp. AL.422]